MKKLVLIVVAVLCTVSCFAQYNPIDPEPPRRDPPPEYKRIFDFIIRMDGPYKPMWVVKNGIKVIGYNDSSYAQSNPANKNQITENMARARLLQWIETYDRLVTSCVKVPLTRQQKDALIDLLYTTGDVSGFLNSQIVRTLNQQRGYNLVPTLLRKIPGDRSRRERECAIWQNNQY